MKSAFDSNKRGFLCSAVTSSDNSCLGAALPNIEIFLERFSWTHSMLVLLSLFIFGNFKQINYPNRRFIRVYLDYYLFVPINCLRKTLWSPVPWQRTWTHIGLNCWPKLLIGIDKIESDIGFNNFHQEILSYERLSQFTNYTCSDFFLKLPSRLLVIGWDRSRRWVKRISDGSTLVWFVQASIGRPPKMVRCFWESLILLSNAAE